MKIEDIGWKIKGICWEIRGKYYDFLEELDRSQNWQRPLVYAKWGVRTAAFIFMLGVVPLGGFAYVVFLFWYAMNVLCSQPIESLSPIQVFGIIIGLFWPVALLVVLVARFIGWAWHYRAK